MSVTETAADQASATSLGAARERILSGAPFTATAITEEFSVDKRAVWDLINRLRREGHQFEERPTGYKNQKEMRWGGQGEKPTPKPAKRRSRVKAKQPNVRTATPAPQPSESVQAPALGTTLTVAGLELAANNAVIAVLRTGKQEYRIRLEPASN